jgi:hypothetical protein
VEVEFFIHGEPLRLVFDTAAVRGCDVERPNKSEMHRPWLCLSGISGFAS